MEQPRPRRHGVSVLGRALAFQGRLGDPGVGTRAELARQLGVSRAFVTQALSVFDAPPALLEALRRSEANGDPVTESVWRRIRGLREAEALAILGSLGAAR